VVSEYIKNVQSVKCPVTFSLVDQNDVVIASNYMSIKNNKIKVNHAKRPVALT